MRNRVGVFVDVEVFVNGSWNRLDFSVKVVFDVVEVEVVFLVD